MKDGTRAFYGVKLNMLWPPVKLRVSLLPAPRLLANRDCVANLTSRTFLMVNFLISGHLR